MKTMFFPVSVAIFGISESPSNLARIIVDNMDRFRFTGIIYLVGDRTGTVAGRPIYTDVKDIPEVPDLAVFLVPAHRLIPSLEACGKKGIRRCVIETGGFSEFGDERKGLEAEILNVAARYGMKVVGPNCVGMINIENGLVLPFYPLDPREVRKGAISIVSQSGGLIHDILMICHRENLGISKCASVGNKLMVDENDILEYLISDPTTDMIGLYLESISDGRRFMDLAGSTTKPVILLKGNTSPESKEIARFHTSALAGDDVVVDAAMRQAGVHRVQNIKEMVECFKAFSLPAIGGSRLAVMARSGGHAVLAADSAHRHGFTLASFSDEFFAMLSERTRAGVIRRTNPIDVGDVFDINVYLEIAEKSLQEIGVDGLLVIHSYALGDGSVHTKQFISSCAQLSRRFGKPIVFCTIGHKEDSLSLTEYGDIPVFTHVDDALLALSAALKHSRNVSPGGRAERCRSWSYGKGDRGGQERERLPSGLMSVKEVFALLERYGLIPARYSVVTNVDEALEAALSMGYPVALKTADPKILHKTDAGGVVLDIRDGEALRRAFQRVHAGPYLLQKMAPPGCECIVGGRKDAEFGAVVLCGIGGTFVEVYRDVAVRVAPVDEPMARQMIGELRGAPILYGFRGKDPYDTDYLVTVLVSISRLLTDHPEIEALDINPLILLDKGHGGIVVDAKLHVAPDLSPPIGSHVIPPVQSLFRLEIDYSDSASTV